METNIFTLPVSLEQVASVIKQTRLYLLLNALNVLRFKGYFQNTNPDNKIIISEVKPEI